jgi:gliding motility-associated-like protein
MNKILTITLSFIFTTAISQTFILPSTGVQSTFSGGCPVGTCSGTLLDPGGAANYPNNVNQIYQTFCPTTPGNCLQVTFTSYNTEASFDYLTIGNGPAQNSAVFTGAPANASGQIWGTPAVPFSYTANNSSGCLTFRFRSDFITTRPGFTASLSCVPCAVSQPAGNADACSSSFICSNLGFNDASSGPGLNVTEGCGGTSCITGENYSNWYTFSVASSGNLTFTLNPNTPTDDFDYAVYGPNSNCNSLGTTPIRCSYAANSGNTGLGNSAGDTSEDVNGDGWTSPMTVTAGQTYMLMVNNWTAGGAGFNILFGGTATIGTLPPAVTSTSICNGSSTVLTATPVASGGTYTWTPGPINSQSISVSPSSTTSYSVSYSMNGCTSSAAVATVSVTNIPVANAGSGTTLTCSSPTATLSGSGGGTYAWSGPGIVSGGASATPVINAPGTYSLIVSSSGCSSTVSTVSISQNTTPPTPSASSSGTLTCNTTTASLNATGGGTYSWSGTGIVSGGSTANPVVNGTGPYVVTVTAANGCTATANTNVSQNITPPTPNASSSGTLTCNTTTASLNATGGGTYSWSGTGIVSGGNTANPVVNGTGPYVVTVTAANGCTATANTNVSQNTIPPTPNASSSGTLTCNTTTASLNATGGGTYTWSGTGIVSGGNTANPVVSGTGPYVVTVTAANGCTATANTNVSQNTTPPTAGASNSGSLTCSTTTVSLNGTGGASYSWSGPGIVSGGNTATPVVNQIGVYTVTVTAANGCTATANTTIGQNNTTPSITMPSTQTITCSSPTVTLVGSANPANSNPVWTGGVCGGANTYSASACSPGIYTLTVTNPANGCINSGTVNVVPSSGVPSVTASTNGSITCSTNTAEVIANTSMSDVTYSWTGPGAISGSSTSNGTVTVGGTYQCIVTNSLTGCSSTITTVVNTNTTAPTTTINVSGILTCSVTSVVVSESLGGTLPCTWTPSSGGTINTPTFTATSPSIYTLTVVDPSNGCTFNTVASVTQNTTVPTGVNAGLNQTLTCVSTSVTLNGSVTNPTNASVNWTGAGVCGNATSLTSAACSAGIYTLTATDPANGCSSTSTVEIAPNAGAPTASITSTALVIDCNNATQSVTVTSAPNTGVTYTWNNAPSSTSPSGDIATFNSPNTYICTVTNTLSNCSTPVQVIVSTNTTVPNISISGTQTLTCSSPTAAITTTATGVTYVWTGSSTIVSGQGTGVVTVNASGDYTVVITDATNGCTNTVTSHIDADTNVPAASISATTSNSTISCQNTSVVLSASVTPSGTYSYTWAPSGNTTTTENVTSAGVYGVLVYNSVTGCTTTAQYTVTGNTVTPTVVTTNTTLPCGSTSVTLNATATNVSYSWSTTNGTISSGSTTSSPTVGSAGDYIVTVTDNSNGCTNSSTVTVISTSVAASFSANPTSGSSPLLVNFTNQTPGTGNIYSWNFGDDNNNTSTSTDPNHTYNTTGNYTVTLTVTDASGSCSSTATISIEVLENSSIIVPNVFTPNGDGKNDVFKITSTGIKEITCNIFNRWGSKVASITEVHGIWDGSNANDGTFFYILTATGFDGTEYKQQGYINLFK